MPLLDWALPAEKCVPHWDGSQQREQLYIPVSVWKAAWPVINHVLQRTWRFQQKRRRAFKDSSTSTRVVDGREASHRTVLSYLTREKLSAILSQRMRCSRSHFVLLATPHLQHLHLQVDAYHYTGPASDEIYPAVHVPLVSDIFAHIPRLRSLHLEQHSASGRNITSEAPFSIGGALTVLPCLTSLRFTSIHGGERPARSMTQLRLALTRVVPSQRSIAARRALAAYVAQRLRDNTARPHIPLYHSQPARNLPFYREQVGVVQKTLRHQRTESASAATIEDSATLLSAAPASTPNSQSSAGSLTILPSSLLAVVCQALSIVELLCLLRCCSSLRSVHTVNDAFGRVAWSGRRLSLVLNKRLFEWTLPNATLVNRCVPLAVWQAALPALQYSLQRWSDNKFDKLCGSMRVNPLQPPSPQQLTTLMQPSGQIVVRNDLTRVTLATGGSVVPRACCYRAHFIFLALPCLQHLHLKIMDDIVTTPPFGDLFSLIPQLRSLHLAQYRSDWTDTSRFIGSIRDMLSVLPCLTSLRCEGRPLGMQDLIDIAAHCTLERIELSCAVHAEFDRPWLGEFVNSA